MNTVDEILASGRYTDRQGRGWDYVETVASWCSPEIDAEGVSWGYRYLDTAQMRLLVERDQHRSECVGLHDCYVHPTPRILFHDGLWSVVAPGLQAWRDSRHLEFADAWDAARALAVGE